MSILDFEGVRSSERQIDREEETAHDREERNVVRSSNRVTEADGGCTRLPSSGCLFVICPYTHSEDSRLHHHDGIST